MIYLKNARRMNLNECYVMHVVCVREETTRISGRSNHRPSVKQHIKPAEPSFWCLAVTSGTTYSFVGASNKIVLALLGHLFFRSRLSLRSGGRASHSGSSPASSTAWPLRQRRPRVLRLPPATSLRSGGRSSNDREPRSERAGARVDGACGAFWTKRSFVA